MPKQTKSTRTKIIASAVTPEQYQILRELAFQREKTLSSLIQELLVDHPDVNARLIAPTADEMSSKAGVMISMVHG